MWLPVPVPGTDFVRLQNRRDPDAFLHIESGRLEAGPVKDNWWSAMWALDGALAPDARSVHLVYSVPETTAFALRATAVRSTPGTFVMAVGFDGGYFGMQEGSDGHKQFRFSVWDQDSRDDRDGVAPENKASVVKLGADVTALDFGNEGTGQSTVRPYDWSEGESIWFWVTAEPAGDATHFSAFVDTGSGWSHIATLARPRTGGRELTGVHSFVEDFLRNGAQERVRAADRSPYQEHVAHFEQLWASQATDTGGWTMTRVRDAKFTAWDQQPTTLTNIDAKALESSFGFGLATGGAWVQNQELDSMLHSDGPAFSGPVPPVVP